MKTVQLAIGLMVFGLAMSANAATMADFSGVWKMTERYCLPDMTNNLEGEVGLFSYDGAAGKTMGNGTYIDSGVECAYTESGDFYLEGTNTMVFKNISHQSVCGQNIHNVTTKELKFSYVFLSPTKKSISTKDTSLCPAGSELMVIEEKL